MKKRFVLFLTFLMIQSVCLTTLAAPEGQSGMENFVKRSNYTEGQFTDVDSNDWFTANVQTVYEYGLMNGKSSTLFGTDSGVTIAETITIASRLHAIYNKGSDQFETDSIWYQAYVDYALQNQIIDQPAADYNVAATRRKFAEILSKALPAKALAEINQIEDDSIPDVGVKDKGADAIYLLYRAGIMVGSDPLGTFHPTANIKRNEVAAVVSRLIDETQRKTVVLKKSAKVIASGSTEDTNVPSDMWDIDRYVSWKLTDDGVLTISGAGQMPGFYWAETPWHAYKDLIRTVIVEDGCENISAKAFESYNSITRVVIADSVNKIGYEAFNCCNNIVEVVLPKEMSEIGHSAFVGTDIKEIVVPTGITKLDRVFLYCEKLEKVYLPESLEYMGHGTFGGCKSLKTLSIPASVTQVNSNFAYGSGLKDIYFYGNIPKGFSTEPISADVAIHFVS